MTPEEIINYISTRYDDVIPKPSWGETSFFYNPEKILPNGVYFCTIKEHDSENDKSSALDRDRVFRLSLGVGKDVYSSLFGEIPKRPVKGGIINVPEDFTKLDLLMPHPIYAWMGWICINCPTKDRFNEITQLIEVSYKRAVESFLKKQKSS